MNPDDPSISYPVSVPDVGQITKLTMADGRCVYVPMRSIVACRRRRDSGTTVNIDGGNGYLVVEEDPLEILLGRHCVTYGDVYQ